MIDPADNDRVDGSCNNMVKKVGEHERSDDGKSLISDQIIFRVWAN